MLGSGKSELPAADAELLAQLDGGFARIAARAGEALACRPGCADCCHTLFPITRLDRLRLREGLVALDSEVAERIRRRAAEQRARLPVDAIERSAEALDALFASVEAGPCPVLDPVSGRCELYEHRPIACRSYGPPLRFAGRDAPHCELCFVGSSPEAIEAARWEPDPAGLERRLLDRIGVPAEESWETLICFALEER